MNTQRLEELLIAWEDDSLSTDELAELKHLLSTEPQARQRLVEAGALQGIAESQARSWEALPPVERERSTAVPRKPWALTLLAGRPLMAAAAGLVLGMLCTSMVWAYVGSSPGKSLTIIQENFESGVTSTIPGLPQKTNLWSGDEAHVVGAEQKIQAAKGAKMLRFTSATYEGENAKQSLWSDVYRLVDLRGQVGDAKSVLRLSASFNACPYPEDEEFAGSVELCTLDEDLADMPQPLTLPWARENGASVALRKVPLKGDGVWKKGVVEVSVSPQTRYVLVHLAVLRKKPYRPQEKVQFGGHYVDDVKLELITSSNPL
jgi:hypothetical protein